MCVFCSLFFLGELAKGVIGWYICLFDKSNACVLFAIHGIGFRNVLNCRRKRIFGLHANCDEFVYIFCRSIVPAWNLEEFSIWNNIVISYRN